MNLNFQKMLSTEIRMKLLEMIHEYPCFPLRETARIFKKNLSLISIDFGNLKDYGYLGDYKKRKYATSQFPFGVEYLEVYYHLNTTKSKKGFPSTAEDILKTFKGEGLMNRDLKKICDLGKVTIWYHLNKLKDAGILEKDGMKYKLKMKTLKEISEWHDKVYKSGEFLKIFAEDTGYPIKTEEQEDEKGVMWVILSKGNRQVKLCVNPMNRLMSRAGIEF